MSADTALAAARATPAAVRYNLRRCWRVMRVATHIGAGFILAFAVGAFHQSHCERHRRAARWWLARLTGVLSLDIEVRGERTAGPALIVANHVSWVDIPVLGAITPVSFLAKSEVGEWPLIGRLATAAGTLYIRRGQGQVRQRARQIGGYIAEGRSILVFPEGTTTNGHDVRSFHSPLFAAASDGRHEVQPVAIRYLDAHGRPHDAVPFIGDDEFVPHLWRLLGEQRVRVLVDFLPPIPAGGCTPAQLAAEAHEGVRAAVTARAAS